MLADSLYDLLLSHKEYLEWKLLTIIIIYKSFIITTYLGD